MNRRRSFSESSRRASRIIVRKRAVKRGRPLPYPPLGMGTSKLGRGAAKPPHGKRQWSGFAVHEAQIDALGARRPMRMPLAALASSSLRLVRASPNASGVPVVSRCQPSIGQSCGAPEPGARAEGAATDSSSRLHRSPKEAPEQGNPWLKSPTRRSQFRLLTAGENQGGT